MKNLKITTASIYNGGYFNPKLNINISNGKTMGANLLHADLKSWLKKEVTAMELTDKYFHLEFGIFKYSNPK